MENSWTIGRVFGVDSRTNAEEALGDVAHIRATPSRVTLYTDRGYQIHMDTTVARRITGAVFESDRAQMQPEGDNDDNSNMGRGEAGEVDSSPDIPTPDIPL
jgi:hypothetical protein